jgi:hypothetical protein
MNTSKLQIGDIVHVRHETGIFARLILWGQDRLLERLCEALEIPVVKSWGNHDGLIVPLAGSRCGLGVCEALYAQGVTVTPWEEYESKIASGDTRVRIYRKLGIMEREGLEVAKAALSKVGEKYDVLAIIKLAWRILKGKFSMNISDDPEEEYCTELDRDSFYIVFGDQEPWQEKHPMPMSTEQIAGELPMGPRKKITLQEVTEYKNEIIFSAGAAVLMQSHAT